MKHGHISTELQRQLDKLFRERYANPEATASSGIEVIRRCEQEEYPLGVAFTHMVVGQSYYMISRYEEGMEHLFDSIRLSQKLGVCDLQLLSYLNIGNIYMDLGDFEKGLDYYNTAERLTRVIQQSMNYFPDQQVNIYLAKIWNNIGEIYRLLNCREEAMKYYLRVWELEEKQDYGATFGMVLVNLGNMELQAGRYDKALAHLTRALQYLERYVFPIGYVEVYGLMAQVYEQLQEYSTCEEYFDKALECASGLEYVYNKIDIYLDFSRYLMHVGRRQPASEKLDEVYNLCVENKMYAKAMEVCKRASEFYEELGDSLNANRYYRLYFENDRMLAPLESEAKARGIRTKVRIEKLERENQSIIKESEAFRRRSEELMELIRNIAIISELGEKLTTTVDLEQIYRMLHETINSFVKADSFAVGIVDQDKQCIIFQYSVDMGESSKPPILQMDNAASVSATCLRENRLIIINDVKNEKPGITGDADYLFDDSGRPEPNSAMFCPLVIDGVRIGVITVQTRDHNSFTPLTVEMMKALSSYAAIAINHAFNSRRLVESNNRLEYLSENDVLTGIANRRKFDMAYNQEWERSRQAEQPLSLIIFDIDCFKQYNDNFGHTEGDNCLAVIARTAAGLLSPGQFAARYGGDEFVIVLPGLELEEAMDFGDGFRRRVEDLEMPHKFSRVTDHVTVTVGISSVVPYEGIEANDLIKQADTALYCAKSNGRNQVVGLAMAEDCCDGAYRGNN